jgi:8-oxo-dGTP pyrophosphatase MutT (NUDIX family)
MIDHMEPLHRQASRIIILDPQDRVLLIQYVRPGGERFWATPGGGLRENESYARAAHRELEEEIGITADALEPLWIGEARYTFGGRDVRQEEHFFLHRLGGSELSEDSQDARMQEGIVDVRWWTIEDLERAEETIYPESLALLLKGRSG